MTNRIFLLISFIFCAGILTIPAQNRNISLLLEKPYKLSDCSFYSCSECDLAKVWSRDGIKADSVDFIVFNEKYRVKSFHKFAKVFRVYNNDLCDSLSLFSFPLNETNLNKKNYASPLIEIPVDKINHYEYFLLHDSPYESDSISVIARNLWLYSTSPIRQCVFQGDTIGVDLGKRNSFRIIRANSIIDCDGYINNIRYQSEYYEGDTVCFSSKYYRIDTISAHKICLYSLGNLQISEFLPKVVLQDLLPYFEKKDMLLIDIWATWCNPCIKGLPEIAKFHYMYEDQIAFLGICQDFTKETEKGNSILKSNQIRFPCIKNEAFGGTLTEKLHVKSYPTYFLIDKRGKIIFKKVAMKGLKELLEDNCK